MMFGNTDINLLIAVYTAVQKDNPVRLLGSLYEEIDNRLSRPVQGWISSRSKAMLLGIADLWASRQQACTQQPAVSRLRPGLKQTDFELPADRPAGRANPSVSQAGLPAADSATVSRPEAEKQLSLNLEQETDPAEYVAAVLAKYQVAEWMIYAPLVAEDKADGYFARTDPASS